MSVGLRCRAHNNFLSAQPDGRFETRPSAGGDWEKFILENVGYEQVAIRTSHGWYVSAQPDGRIEKRPSAGGDWEKFYVQRNADGTSSFRSCHGKYLCDEGSSGIWNRDVAGPWEQFEIVPIGGGGCECRPAGGGVGVHT